jgi:hypothetical protein
VAEGVLLETSQAGVTPTRTTWESGIIHMPEVEAQGGKPYINGVLSMKIMPADREY